MKTIKEDYRKYMFQYGILSVLFVLEHFEHEEEFEECQKIIDAIQEQEKKLEITLFTNITTETIKEVIDNYKNFNLTGVNAVENSKHYANVILKEIKWD
jgi:pentose-5-phosphate-3-epimerase